MDLVGPVIPMAGQTLPPNICGKELSPRLQAFALPLSEAHSLADILGNGEVLTLLDEYGWANTHIACKIIRLAAQHDTSDHTLLADRYFYLPAKHMASATSWDQRRQWPLCNSEHWNGQLVVIDKYDCRHAASARMLNAFLNWRTIRGLPTIITASSLACFDRNSASVRRIINDGSIIQCDT